MSTGLSTDDLEQDQAYLYQEEENTDQPDNGCLAPPLRHKAKVVFKGLYETPDRGLRLRVVLHPEEIDRIKSEQAAGNFLGRACHRGGKLDGFSTVALGTLHPVDP